VEEPSKHRHRLWFQRFEGGVHDGRCSVVAELVVEVL